MKVYNSIYSNEKPLELEICQTKIYIASNIKLITRYFEGKEEKSYCYTLTEYDKDEYLIKNKNDIDSLKKEVQKIKTFLKINE